MAFTEKDKEGNLLIKIEGSLSAYEVAGLRDQMLLGFENGNGVTLDIDGITDCDTLGVQLFCSAGKTARLKNKNFSISGKSEACRTVALNIGLDLEVYLSS